MSQHNLFLTQVVNDPENDDERLIYADWLEEAGDPRGDFIRAQCAVAQKSELDLDYYDHFQRQDELLSIHRDTWVNELGQDVKKAQFHRGFIESVTAWASQIVKTDGKLFEQTPIHWLRLNRVRNKGAELARLSSLSKLRGLDISGIVIPHEDMGALLNSPNLQNLERLKTRHYSATLSPKSVTLLKESGTASRLKHFEVSKTDLSMFANSQFDELQRLVVEGTPHAYDQTTPPFSAPNLKELELYNTCISSSSIGRFGVTWESVQKIQLNCYELYPNAIDSLAKKGAFQSAKQVVLRIPQYASKETVEILDDNQLGDCRELELCFNPANFDEPDVNPIKHDFVSSLAGATHVTELKELIISDLWPGDLTKIARASHLHSLESLCIKGSIFSRDDILALVESPLRNRLRRIGFNKIAFEPGAAEEFVEHEFPNVIALEIGDEGFQTMSGRLQDIVPLLIDGRLPKVFPQLRLLNLDQQTLGKSGLNELAKLSLPELRILSYQFNRSSQADIAAFMKSNQSPKLFQIRVHGTITTKNREKFEAKFGHQAKLDLFYKRNRTQGSF